MPVVCVSGRPADYRDVTERWLANNGVPYAALYMRAAGDRRPDDTVKREILDALRADGWVPKLVVDDRQRVVDMWRAQGLICLQAQPDVGWGRPPENAPATLLYLMVGPSGGGKSTLVSERFNPQWVISSDEIRATVYGDQHNQTHNQAVFEAVHDVAKTRLRRGMPTVIDATHLRRKDRMGAAQLTPEGFACEYVVCNRPLDAKKATADWRPEWLINKHEQTFRSQEADILLGDGLSFVQVTDTRPS
jgi:predicted kinase